MPSFVVSNIYIRIHSKCEVFAIGTEDFLIRRSEKRKGRSKERRRDVRDDSKGASVRRPSVGTVLGSTPPSLPTYHFALSYSTIVAIFFHLALTRCIPHCCAPEKSSSAPRLLAPAKHQARSSKGSDAERAQSTRPAFPNSEMSSSIGERHLNFSTGFTRHVVFSCCS